MNRDSQRESLAARFERHADEEGKILADYRVLSDKLGDTSLGNLVSHILTEEEMHHLLLRTLAKWMRDGAADRSLPGGADRGEILRLTQLLQKHEGETIDACRELKTQFSGADSALFATLVDAMELDSEKHHRLLAAVVKLLES